MHRFIYSYIHVFSHLLLIPFFHLTIISGV